MRDIKRQILYGSTFLLMLLAAAVTSGGGNMAKNQVNHLSKESSLYLQQHSRNPIDWYPWGPEALTLARTSERPIFLSIGYSACHWCHVMAQESFEDQAVAKVLNANFVCIKVDREERPDIDTIYMNMAQTLTGRGGWPLNLFLTPDLKPFSVGTYISRETLLKTAERIAELWKKDRKVLLTSAENLNTRLIPNNNESRDDAFYSQLENTAWKNLQRDFDPVNGGFGGAPKFPAAHRLLFLLRYYYLTNQPDVLNCVYLTLDKMRMGGIYDQLGYGFHRYSTDANWKVPHFEKMLYDQAMLMMVYTEAWQVSGRKNYADIVREIFRFISRDLTSPDGAFYATIDANANYYLWSSKELRSILNAGEFGLSRRIFNIRTDGNFKPEHGSETGNNILYQSQPLTKLVTELNCDLDTIQWMQRQIQDKLYAVRKKRLQPTIDHKIITGWNGMMIVALAKAGSVMNRRTYLNHAIEAAEFIRTQMKNQDGGLCHCNDQNQAKGEATLNDYAYMIWAMVELYEATYNKEYLDQARQWTQYVNHHFADQNRGGYFDTSDHAEKLLQRPRTIYDGPYPSGSTIMVLNMFRLASLAGDSDLATEAEKKATAVATEINRSPENGTMILNSLMFARYPAWQIVVVGRAHHEDTELLLDGLQQPFCPFKSLDLLEADENGNTADVQHCMIKRQATVYICRNRECRQPVTSLAEAWHILGITPPIDPAVKNSGRNLKSKE